MMSQGFDGKCASLHGVMNQYEFNSDGTIEYTLRFCKPQPYLTVSDSQYFGEAQDCFDSVTNNGPIDVYMRDEIANMGTTTGGIHAGEPLPDKCIHNSNGAPLGQALISGLANKVPIALNHEMARPGKSQVAGGAGAQSSCCSSSCSFSGGCGATKYSTRDDFGLGQPNPQYVSYPMGPAGGGARQTYLQNGLGCDIRFRWRITKTTTTTTTITDDTTGAVLSTSDANSDEYGHKWDD